MSIWNNYLTIPEHPEIAWIERTGYPSWMQEGEEEYGLEPDEE